MSVIFQGQRFSCVLLLIGLSCTLACIGPTAKTSSSSDKSDGGAFSVVKIIDLTQDGKDNFITALAWANESLWAGTEHSLFRLNAEDGGLGAPVRLGDAVDNARVNSVRTCANEILVASSEGFAHFRDDSWVRNPLGNTNDVFRVDHDLWSATNSGLERLRKGSREWCSFDVSSVTDYSPTHKMTCLASDEHTNIWVGTQFGLHHFDLAAYHNFLKSVAAGGAKGLQAPIAFWSRKFGDYQNPSGGLLASVEGNCPLLGNQIKVIKYVPETKTFLFCTEAGITTFNGTDWHSYHGTGNMFVVNDAGELDRRPVSGNIDVPTSAVYDAISHKGVLYLATRSGIACVQADRTTVLITMEDGLPSNAIRSLAIDSKGELLFAGTENGLALIRLL